MPCQAGGISTNLQQSPLRGPTDFWGDQVMVMVESHRGADLKIQQLFLWRPEIYGAQQKLGETQSGWWLTKPL